MFIKESETFESMVKMDTLLRSKWQRSLKCMLHTKMLLNQPKNKPSVVKLIKCDGITLDELITGVKPGDPEEIAVLKKRLEIAEREIDLLKRAKALLEKGA